MSAEAEQNPSPTLSLYAFAERYRILGPSLEVADTMQGFWTRAVWAIVLGVAGVLFWIGVLAGERLFIGPAVVFTIVSVFIVLITVRRGDYERLASLYQNVESALWTLSLTCAVALDAASVVVSLVSPRWATSDAIVLQVFSAVMAGAALLFVAQARDYTPALLSVDRRRHPLRRRLYVMTAQWLAFAGLVADVIIAVVRFGGLGTAGVGILVAGMSFMLGVLGAQRTRTWADAAAIVAALDEFGLRLREVEQSGPGVDGTAHLRRCYLALDRACTGDGRTTMQSVRNPYVDSAVSLVLAAIGDQLAELDSGAKPEAMDLLLRHTGFSSAAADAVPSAYLFVERVRLNMARTSGR